MTTRLMLHQDDVGMCHGANVAFVELSHLGVVDAGSVMMPCPWSSETCELVAADPTLDLGVHLTLTAEKRHYRWRPLTTASPASGLVDADGFMWKSVADVRQHGDPAAVDEEMRAQVEQALALGADVTHLDAHMGAALAPEFLASYLALGGEYQVPVLLTRQLSGYGANRHLHGADEQAYASMVRDAAAAGAVVFDGVGETPFDRDPGPVDSIYRDMVAGLGEGLWFLALHPNAPGELEAIEPDSAFIRTDEYELFRAPPWRSWLGEQPLERVGFRALRDEVYPIRN